MCSDFISAAGCYTDPVRAREISNAAGIPATNQDLNPDPSRRVPIRARAFFAVCLPLAAWLGICPALFAKSPAHRPIKAPRPLIAPRPIVVGYVFPRNTLLDPVSIPARKLTRINYAFAAIQNGRIADAYPSDDPNLAALVALKRQNPALTVLVSVGGWFGSSEFSDIALTPRSRAAFIASAVEYVEQHRLDGIDIDWEYPGMAGATKHFRAEDGLDFTLLLEETRAAFDRLEKKLHRRLYLTIAAGATPEFLAHTQMDAVGKVVDTVNLMAYDVYEPSSDRTTGNAAPLFTDPADPKQLSAERAVRAFEQAGVPAARIVLGVPFYGHAWRSVPGTNHGLFQPGKRAAQPDVPYGDGPDELLRNGFTRYWDASAAAAFLYNPAQKIFISYEDPQSLAAKCRYVLGHKLAGMMFWNLEDDPTGALLDAIDAGLGKSSPVNSVPASKPAIPPDK